MNGPDPHSSPGEVSRLQHWFQAVVTHAEGVEAGANSEEAQRLIRLSPGELEKVITRSRALSAAERLAIYANAYHTRLLECLGEVFPMLKRALGEDAFNGLAFAYLQDYPSRSYTLNELGKHFPGYLETTRPAPDPPDPSVGTRSTASLDPPVAEDWPGFLIDLARLEWAFYEVFDGPGVEGQSLLGTDQLLDIPSDRWGRIKLEPVPCLQLLASRFPVNDYFSALRRAKPEESVPIPAPSPSFVALNRRQFIVRRYNLSRTEFELLSAIKAGRSVGQAIEAVAGASDDWETLASDLTLWFRNWTAEGFFQSVKLIEP